MLDVIILMPMVYGLARGIMRGFVKELVAVFGLLAAFLCARFFADDAAPIVQSWFTWETGMSRTVAFLAIFFIVSIVLSVIGWLLTKLLKAVHLDWLNRLGGAAVGLVKWAFVVSLVINCIDFVDGYVGILKPEVKEQSYTYEPVKKIASVFLDKWDNMSSNNR